MTYLKEDKLHMTLTRIEQVRELRDSKSREIAAIINKVSAEKRTHLTTSETRRFKEANAAFKLMNDELSELITEENRGLSPEHWAEYGARDQRGGWAQRAAKAIQKMGGESRAIASGSVDVPSLVDPAVTPKSRPGRLIDLLVTRSRLESNSFEYFRQSVRTTNAAPVADLATKPTSTYTLVPVVDRARVIAHLSEAVPIRLWQDAVDVIRWLEIEMQEGVLSSLESQVIQGSGTGENLTGILNVAGTTQIAYATDIPTTLRKAITALQQIGVQPSAWAINPADAEALDLLKEGTGGVGFLLDGVNNGTASSGNVLGDNAIQRVVTPSVPAGTAVLGDWSAARLYVREDMRLDVDSGGALFDTNAAKMRAEIRVGLGHLHPASFAICDLTE